MALGTNAALLAATVNDIAFDVVFVVYGLGRAGDVSLAISTTGTSRSGVNAALVTLMAGLSVVSLTGREGGDLARMADAAIHVPADRVFEIQALHVPSTTR